MALGHRRPDVDRPLGPGHVHADLLQRGADQVAAARVDGVHLTGDVVTLVEHGGLCKLHRLEHARVDVGLQLPVGLDGLRVADDGRGAPAGHVVALGQREDLDPDLLGPGRGQEAGRHVAVEGGLGVRGVVDDQDVVGAGEVDRLLEQPVGHHRAGGVVRVVEVHQPRAVGVLGGDRAQVGGEAALGQQRHQDGLGAGQQRSAGVDRVARVGGQRGGPGVQEGEVEVEHALLGPQRRDDLGLGVQRHAEAAVVEAGQRLAQLGAAAVGGVLVGARVGRGGGERLGGQRRRGRVGIADPQRDDVHALRPSWPSIFRDSSANR